MSPRLEWRRADGVAPTASRLVAVTTVGAGDNLLVHGDNLAALACLRDSLAGQVGLVYLDPPYNTGSAFDHYDDHRAPEDWLTMMAAVLEGVKPLLSPRGVVALQTDRHESAYAKVLLDMVFGRKAYQTTLAVRMSATSGYKIEHSAHSIVKNVEHIHLYAPGDFVLHARAYEVDRYDDHYNLFVHGEGESRWVGSLLEVPDVVAMFEARGLAKRSNNLATLYEQPTFQRWVADHADRIVRAHTAPGPARAEHAEKKLFPEGAPAERVIARHYRGQDYLLRQGSRQLEQLIPIGLKLHLTDDPELHGQRVLTNVLGDWWDGFHLDMGNVAKEGAVPFKNGKKPERLLQRLMAMLTEPGDRVLDPFGGSGTTAAVAHKMGRRWTLIEAMGQWETHIVPRMERVVAGADPTGVTEATGWRGGGGFSVMRVEATTMESC